MLNQTESESLKQSWLTLLVIGCALVVGSIVASIVVFFLVKEKINRDTDVLVLIGVAVAFVNFASAFFVPALVRNQYAKQLASMAGKDSEDLAESRQKRFAEAVTQVSIVRLALLEGSVFLSLAFVFMTNSAINWIPVGIGIVLMGLLLPTPTRSTDAFDDLVRRARAEQGVSSH